MSGPLPPANLNLRTPRIVAIEADATLHRFYTSAYAPLFYDRSPSGRLNAPDGSYGVLYAAKRSRGAFAETFLRTPGRQMLDPSLLARTAYVNLRVRRKINLINFDGPGLAILGATAEVVHGSLPYDIPQAWSAALHAHPGGMDGIAYTARHDPHELCYALFERAAAGVEEQRRIVELDADWLWRLADAYEVGKAP